ncbi:MAG: iron-sulfur cluster assembly accessory protein [Proteobacteria bacterium]|nr:iron-sulfur cluster assembly accessory protein [Pseudomonadota bacterium]
MNEPMIKLPTDLPTGDPGLKITSNALGHLRRSLEKASKKPMGIRVGVKKAGCSGYEYVLEYAYPENQKPVDYAFTVDEITVLVDKEIYLKFFKGGTVMDFRKEGINEGLQFDNPNVGNQCGCGESFTLTDE